MFAYEILRTPEVEAHHVVNDGSWVKVPSAAGWGNGDIHFINVGSNFTNETIFFFKLYAKTS